MSSLCCITNDIPDLRPCTIKGLHAANCTGYGTRWDAEAGQRIQTDRECEGCLPSPADKGLLCWSCWEKVQDGLKIAVDMVTHLRSVERAQQVDNAGVRGAFGPADPLPSTWQMGDDIIVLLGHPDPGFPSDATYWEVEAIVERYVDAIEPALWVASTAGAIAAVRFNAAMSRALIAHPMEDYEHKVRNVRCPKCKQRTMLWKPPLLHKDEVRVECTNCGFAVDQTGYGQLRDVERLYVRERISTERKRVADAKRAAARAAKRAAAEARKVAAEAAEQQEVEEALCQRAPSG